MIEATELEYWAALGNLEQVARALAANPDVNVRGVGGYTAMHAAAENGHLEVLRFLLSRGGAVSPRTDDGKTPLALGAGHPEVVSLLRSLGGE
jgi:uncharacterized protein